MSEYEARQALQQIFDQFERRQQVRRGLLGDSNGVVQVANRPGWAYIRYHDNLNELAIVRYLIPDQFPDGMPVVVGKKHPQDPYEQVLGVDWAMYAWEPASSTVTDHATQAIDLNDISLGKVVPTDPVSLSVDVRAFLYVNGDSAVEYGGGSIDLTGNVPGVAGHRLVLVYMDLDTDSLAAEDGDIVAVGTDASAPTVPENGLPLAVVDLANGEATIEAGDIHQYKALFLVVGELIDLTQLSDYARGYIIRGGAADWEAHDASGDGYVLVGDGTDIASEQHPSLSGNWTWNVGPQTIHTGNAANVGLVIVGAAAQAEDLVQIHDSGANVLSGFDERGIVFSDGDTSSTNFFGGADAGRAAATGAYNIGIGRSVLQALTSGYNNVALGDEVLFTLLNGYSNIGIGKGALYSTEDGTHSIAIGVSALYTSVSDDDNVVVGSTAGFNLNGANRVIFIGRDAGFRQTNASDRLLIDNQRRADIATELTHAILYGTMAANPEDQQLTVNASELHVGEDNTPAYGAFLTANAVDNVGTTIIANATGDVTVGMQVMYFVSESAGGTEGGMVTVDNGGNADLYDDGTDVLNLAVAADGSVTLQRTAGAATFDVSLWACWV